MRQYSLTNLMSLHTRKFRFLVPLLLSCYSFFTASAQNNLIQLSGIITDERSNLPVSYATVIVESEYRGVNATMEGFFSIVVARNDTIQFSALGYKPKYYVVPDTGSDNIASIAVFLKKDTITLDVVEIYPWPSPEDFRDAFLAYQENRQYTVGPIPGLKSPGEIDTVPKPPSPIMNPISFFYEEVIKPIQWQKRKRNMPAQLPEWK